MQVPMVVMTVRDTEGHAVAAPLVVWMQAMFQSFPPEWQQEIMTMVAQAAAKQQERPRIQVVGG